MKTPWHSGFTLIEMLIVVASFATLSVIVMQSLLITVKSSALSNSHKKLKQEGDVILSTIQSHLRNASDIDASCTDTPTGSISFTNQDGEYVTYDCTETGGMTALRETIDGSASVLTSTTTSLGAETCANANLEFTCETSGDGSVYVTFRYELWSYGSSSTLHVPFSSSVSVRN